MLHSFQYAYLTLDLLLLPFWLFCFWYRKDVRKQMVCMGLIFAVIATLLEFLFLSDYWQPTTINSFAVTLYGVHYEIALIEDLIWGFLFGGIAAVIYEEIFGIYLRANRKHIRPSIRMMAAFLVIGIVFLIAPTMFFNMPVVYAAILSCLASSMFYIFFRHDLFRDALISGFVMGGIYFLVLLIFSIIFSGIFDAWWYRDSLSGVSALHIPIEELLIAFAMGAVVGPFYEFFFGLSVSKIRIQK